MKFTVKVDTAPAQRAFRETRRDLNQTVKRTMGEVGRQYGLPAAKRNLPSILKRDVIVKSTTRDLFFTTRPGLSKQIRGRFWILEFGGSIRAQLRGVKGPIPIIAAGGGLQGFRMTVNNPRRIQAKKSLQKTVVQIRPTVVRVLEKRIGQDIQNHLDKHAIRATSIV